MVQDSNLSEVVSHCHLPDCSWLHLSNLTALQNVPHLVPNPELSGIGVVLGFSISAYLTIVLLVLHYITVHNVRRTNRKGDEYVSSLDDGILTFVRGRIISWQPSRRFEYAMEKSVLILSDLNLVTGLGLLIAGYSQLNCGISAYHWQIMVFVAWFASFSFVSAMTFLEGYLQTNSSMRIIRVSLMCVLASLLIAALLPTGSNMWLNEYPNDGEGFYPSLSAACFYREMTEKSFLRQSPKIWSMVFSIIVVIVSYIHCIVRLFDPTAGVLRKYLRHWPGSKLKAALHYLEPKVLCPGVRARLWCLPYLVLYAVLTASRALYDISESMLLEIIWLTFAMSWGTIKVWTTRSSASYNYDGISYSLNHDVLEENAWSFGQMLPLILLLLPLLSMAQAYLDNDAKALKTPPQVPENEEAHYDHAPAAEVTGALHHVEMIDRRDHEALNQCRSTFCDINRCNLSHSLAPRCSIVDKAEHDITAHSSAAKSTPVSSARREFIVHLPRYPYEGFTGYPWYHDQILLLLMQIILLTAFALWVLTELANVFGISALLRNKVFLIWVLGIVPIASVVHLTLWYVAALFVAHVPTNWLEGRGRSVDDVGKVWWRRVTLGKVVYWLLRMGLVGGCLVFTFFISLDLAGPTALVYIT